MRHRTASHAVAAGRSARPGRSGGGFLLGVFVGLVLGLGVALGVAFYLNRTPMPFLGKSKPAAGKEAAEPAKAFAGMPQSPQAGGAPPRGIAVGNQIAAAIFLLPLLAAYPPLAPPTWLVAGNVLGLALLASAIGFLLYFRLIADIGATRALTVTYLVPLFGLAWGALFLGETLPATALAGAVLILAGTAFVTRG